MLYSKAVTYLLVISPTLTFVPCMKANSFNTKCLPHYIIKMIIQHQNKKEQVKPLGKTCSSFKLFLTNGHIFQVIVFIQLTGKIISDLDKW